MQCLAAFVVNSRLAEWTNHPPQQPPSVVAPLEFVRMRTQAHGFGFVLPPVIDERLDGLFGDQVAPRQEGTIIFQAVQDPVQRLRR